MATSALRLFQRFGGSAFGRWLFARAICLKAPYFASIAPRIDVLEAGRCVVRMRDRRAVRNHIGSVHAIALCNMAELAAGLATDATIPDSMRWIPKGMDVRYLRKAYGAMTATATLPPIAAAAEGSEARAVVVVVDAKGDAVFSAEVAMWISPRKAA